MGDLLLVRHGQTEWSRSGQHTGRTDIALTPYGERQAASLAPLLQARTLAATWTSPLQRARRTAELAGQQPEVDEDLVEWDNGEYEGRTTAQIREDRAGWWLWTDGAPGGEDWRQVQARCERALSRVAPTADQPGDVVLFGHGHALRALAAVWVGLPASQGGIFTLEEASLSVLGHYRGHQVVKSWNDVTVHPPQEPLEESS